MVRGLRVRKLRRNVELRALECIEFSGNFDGNHVEERGDGGWRNEKIRVKFELGLHRGSLCL